jgi:EAL domain-containing protein (putative c-di-GMP-specific phosphodiesterase class I)/DNA-binding NarL/FixJ family response regulator
MPASDSRAASDALPHIDVIVIDDDEVVRRVLCGVLATHPRIRVRGEAADAGAGAALAYETQPDVALVDVEMPAGGGPVATRGIAKFSPKTAVLAVSAREDRRSVVGMLRAGAVGYLVKGSGDDEILEGVLRAARRQHSVSAAVLDKVLAELSDKLAAEESHSEREREELWRVREVIERDLLHMVFQPIIDVATGDVIAMEALARFAAEPVRGPHEWFAAADEVGALAELELAAVGAVIERLPELPAGMRVSINLSPSTALTAGFAEVMQATDAARLVLEITEHAPVEDYDALALALRDLREEGLLLAVDDAGAGFASLRHILRLAPDVVKLDMAVTRGIETDPGQRALARALISFAAEMDAMVVAEGIETESELAAMRDLGARFAQGYLLGRPAPLPAPVATPLSRPHDAAA